MNKILSQAVILVALFFATWFIFSQIDWMTILKVEKLTNKTEEKLGDLFWDSISRFDKEVKNEKITAALDSLLSKICVSNNIDKEQIKMHIVNNDEINAFALPGKHLVIFSGLIISCDNEEELSGVICHELAHIELNHVMKKLIKEVGLSVLISMASGNSGSNIAIKTSKLLSSSAYDRRLEEDADIKAVDYLINSNINPDGFAGFLYKLADNESITNQYLTWVSTHPELKKRAEYIIEYSRDRPNNYQSVLTQYTWDELVIRLKNM